MSSLGQIQTFSSPLASKSSQSELEKEERVCDVLKSELLEQSQKRLVYNMRNEDVVLYHSYIVVLHCLEEGK